MTRPFKLLALCGALAAASGNAAAQSQVTVYGLASVEMLNITGFNNGTLAAPQIGTQRRLDNSKVTNSRLGFRGVEDLGSGLSAVFGLEGAIALDTGAQANASKFWNRGSYVGLSSRSLGTLTFGRQWDIEDSIMARYFIGAGYAVFQFSEFGYISDLVDNAVKYVSPKMGGLTVQALAAPGEGSGRVWEVGGTYALGPFDMGLTHRRARNAADVESRQSSFGLSYSFGTVRVHGGIAVSDPKALGLAKARAYDLGVVWDALPQTQVTLDYVKRDLLDSPDDSYYVRLQGTYSLSKRTALFVNLVTLKNEGQAREKFYGAGAPGVDQNVTSLGIRHWF
ncbi:porin [Piscinibacter sp.]|uniref:porin n=1 Tax=Piscinibacter sp. TaxID=1903157 RepID=UPI0039E32178